MSTIDKEFADKIAACNGVLYPDDPFEPPVVRIVEYTNARGKKAYGITFEGQDEDKYMRSTAYVQGPSVYWQKLVVEDDQDGPQSAVSAAFGGLVQTSQG